MAALAIKIGIWLGGGGGQSDPEAGTYLLWSAGNALLWTAGDNKIQYKPE